MINYKMFLLNYCLCNVGKKKRGKVREILTKDEREWIKKMISLNVYEKRLKDKNKRIWRHEKKY